MEDGQPEGAGAERAVEKLEIQGDGCHAIVVPAVVLHPARLRFCLPATYQRE